MENNKPDSPENSQKTRETATTEYISETLTKMAVSQDPPSLEPNNNTNTQNEEQEKENNKPDSSQQLPNSSSPPKNTQSSGLVYVQIFKYMSETLTKRAVSQNPPSSKPNTQTEEQEMENNKLDSPQQPPVLPNSSSPSKNTQSSVIETVQIFKYCHQCRQRTMKFETCKNQRNNKPCTIKFCKKCLFNRYGEKAEEVALLDDWKCPKCRDICNCSCCMKRKGGLPTGRLAHTAKATGFSPGYEMEIANMSAKDASASLENPSTSNKELVVVSPRKVGKENSFKGNGDSYLELKSLISEDDGMNIDVSKRKNNSENDSNEDGAQSEKTSKKSRKYEEIPFDLDKKEEKLVGNENSGISGIMSPKKCQTPNESAPNLIKKEQKMAKGNDDGLLDEENNSLPVCDDEVPGLHEFEKNGNTNTEAYIPLPQGIDLTTVAGIDLPAQDVGYALQFLEFCKAFGEVFNLKEGLPESVLRELTHGCLRCRGQSSSILQFHVQLLSLMQKDSGAGDLFSPSSENSWLQVLGKCLSESQWELEDFSVECFDEGVDGYDKLDLSTKLKLLNFLCDEALGTQEIRSCIEKQNLEFIDSKKASKRKVVAAKDKEKSLKQKMKDEIANAVLKNGAPLSISEHDNLVLKMKIEVAEAHTEMLEAKSMATKMRSDAVRTESILLDGNDHAFWRLESYSDEPHILLQDFGNWDSVTPQDKWFTYDSEQYKAVEDYISAKRNKKAK